MEFRDLLTRVPGSPRAVPRYVAHDDPHGEDAPRGPGKTCPRCRVERPLSAFRIDRGRPDGLQTYCRPCQRDLGRVQPRIATGRSRRGKSPRNPHGTAYVARVAAWADLLAWAESHGLEEEDTDA